MVYFFFSSRRRHTRLQGDWSSDVCSSDLPDHVEAEERDAVLVEQLVDQVGHQVAAPGPAADLAQALLVDVQDHDRSEERRVGKECSDWWSRWDYKKSEKNISSE